MSIISRFSNRPVFANRREEYQTYFDDRGVRQITQYTSPRLRYPTADEIVDLDVVSHIYTSVDSLSNLAARYYDDPTLWWIIAWFNKKPGDFAIKPADVIYIPFPLEYILANYGY